MVNVGLCILLGTKIYGDVYNSHSALVRGPWWASTSPHCRCSRTHLLENKAYSNNILSETENKLGNLLLSNNSLSDCHAFQLQRNFSCFDTL